MAETYSIPSVTALGGSLTRTPEGWQWSDGTPEPRASDLRLRDIAPNFRCVPYGSGTCVEVPHNWRDWPGAHDPEVIQALRELLKDYGKPAAIYAEGLAELTDMHQLTRHGHLVPLPAWDAAMAEPVGARWDKRDEPDILTKARALGWDG
jgi:hypothetical protein